MANLNAGSSPFGVDRIGHLTQGRDNLVAQPQLLIERDTAAVYRGVGYGGHADAATCYADMVIFELLGRSEVLAH